MNQHLMTDDVINITVTIGQQKIHVGSAKFHISMNGLSMSGAVNSYIIGPHFFNDTQVTGAMYNYLKNNY